MKNPKDELIWQGRIHLGDEPGVYGDASYSGLCTERPIAVLPFDPTGSEEEPKAGAVLMQGSPLGVEFYVWSAL